LWISGICCPHDQLALYGAARRLVLLVTLPVQMLNLTVISAIAELHGQGRRAELQKVLRGAATFAAVPSIAAIVVLIIWGGPILQILFGPYFRDAAMPLGILGLGQLFLVCAGSCGCALEMTGHQMVSLIVNLISAVALGVVGTFAAQRFGIMGLAVASASVIGLQSVTLWLLARRIVGVWTHPTLSVLTPNR
jgi:O-antigen/teichoic acid export membrane protein